MIQRLVQNLSSSSGINPSLRMNIQKNGPVQEAASRLSSNSRVKKTEAQTSDFRGGVKREQVKKELSANTLHVRNTEKAPDDYRARKSHSVAGKQPQSRTALNGVSGGAGRVRAEKRDKINSNNRDDSVLEYSDSDSDERVMGSAHYDNGTARNGSHFSDRISSTENMCRREDDEYEDDFENYSSGEDPEPAMPPPPAYQLQNFYDDDEQNSLQAQGKGRAFKHPYNSNGDMDISAMARGALNGAEAGGYFIGDQSVPMDADTDRKHRGGPDKESSTTQQNRRGDTPKTSNGSPQVKSVSDKYNRLSPGLTGSSATGRIDMPQRGVSAMGQPKGLSNPQSQCPLQQRQRGEESKGASERALGGRAGPVNGTAERNSSARAPSASTSNSAVADQRARLEQRAADRRERVLFLQRQAEERVLSKLRETEQQIKYVLHERYSLLDSAVLVTICIVICCLVAVACTLNIRLRPHRLKDAQEYESLEKLRCEKR
jgi:hypothetical protein